MGDKGGEILKRRRDPRRRTTRSPSAAAKGRAEQRPSRQPENATRDLAVDVLRPSEGGGVRFHGRGRRPGRYRTPRDFRLHFSTRPADTNR